MALKISELILIGALTSLAIMLIMTAKITKEPEPIIEENRPAIIIEEIE
ncbi:hypothetical protein PBCV1_a603bR [Paramecium bursaria Chlorella virus 1]|uniref:Uncharacterized protein n=1 Tax=Paramecium bursaria Chlorella virus 1 TaxID=10506 RepID=F8TU68_PBCV1|nr:hypothetical protein PBCV1_a603bR [Paramecium bursaria Chlorella virus 1]AEI70129.1 hypothetical protein [Paramecium bursaria Chlorella virus 1]